MKKLPRTHAISLVVYWVSPQLRSIIPNNTDGFSDIEKAAQVFVTN
ncbi:hypothetical protein [Phytohalomonas tamaricis]|nr:hypothetical protein [Phytohalomonas tamaricis]